MLCSSEYRTMHKVKAIRYPQWTGSWGSNNYISSHLIQNHSFTCHKNMKVCKTSQANLRVQNIRILSRNCHRFARSTMRGNSATTKGTTTMIVLAKPSLARFCFDVIVLGKACRQLSLVPNMSQIARKPRQSHSSMLSCLLEKASWNINCRDFTRWK